MRRSSCAQEPFQRCTSGRSSAAGGCWKGSLIINSSRVHNHTEAYDTINTTVVLVKVCMLRNRVLYGANERLEPDDRKRSRPVLRGRGGGNTALLPHNLAADSDGATFNVTDVQ